MPTTKKYRVKITNYCGNTVYSSPVDVAVCSPFTAMPTTVFYSTYNDAKTFYATDFVATSETSLTYSWQKQARTYNIMFGCLPGATTYLGTGASQSITESGIEFAGTTCPDTYSLVVTNTCGAQFTVSSYMNCQPITIGTLQLTSVYSYGTGYITSTIGVDSRISSKQTYQWSYSSTASGTYTDIGGATSSTYGASNTGYYKVRVCNNCQPSCTTSTSFSFQYSATFGGGYLPPPGVGTFP